MNGLKNRIGGLLELIGLTLQRKREVRGWTQKAIADEAGITLSTYGDMERGARHYRIDAFLRVLHVFQLDIMRSLETAQPRRNDPKHEAVHEKLQDLLHAKDPWPTIAMTNVEAVWMKWKSEQTKL